MERLNFAEQLVYTYNRKSAFAIIDILIDIAKKTLTQKEIKELMVKVDKDKETSTHYNGTVINNIVYRPNEYASQKSLIIFNALRYFEPEQLDLIYKAYEKEQINDKDI